jgi:hypothetical protein
MGTTAFPTGGSMILSETIFIDHRPVGVVRHDSHTGQVKFSPIKGTSPLPDKRWRDVDKLKQALFRAYRKNESPRV